MLPKLLMLCLTVVVICGSDELERNMDFDPILYYLLNGEYEEPMPNVDVDSEDAELNGGLWKCGRCEDISQFRLIYSETNTDDATDDNSVQKIEVSLPGVKCVIVRSSSANIVRSVDGDCEGPSVVITLAPTERFVLDVYGHNDDNDKETLTNK